MPARRSGCARCSRAANAAGFSTFSTARYASARAAQPRAKARSPPRHSVTTRQTATAPTTR